MIIKEIEASDYNCHYPDALHCAGCRCMAWRWAVQKRLVIAPSDDAPANEYYTSETSTTHGYCGLAGRP